MPDAVKAAGLDTGSRSGQFLVAIRDVSARLAALQTAIPLALVILAAIAALTIWELAGLTARTRATETALLWSRGATTASLSARAGAEVGGDHRDRVRRGRRAWRRRCCGACEGRMPRHPLSGPVSGPQPPSSPRVPSRSALRTVRHRRARRVAADRAGRARSFAGAGGVVLLLDRRRASRPGSCATYGPVTQTALGGASVDPVTVVAPALILASVVLLGLYAFPLLAAAAERGAVRGTGAGAGRARSVAPHRSRSRDDRDDRARRRAS